MSQQQELIPLTPGDYLRQQRLARQLSLAAVARKISLDENLLRAIEEDRAGHIAAIYRSGYLRNYARFLKIPEDMIESLLEPSQQTEPVLRTIFTEPPKRNPVDNWLRATSYVLASLLIGTLAWQFTHEAVRLSQNGSRLHSGEEGVQVTGNHAQTDSTLSGPVNASIAHLDALQNVGTGSPEAGEQAWAALSGSSLPEGQSRLQLSVTADSWVEISDADGLDLEMDLLRAGSDKNYQGKPPFRILFGRASAVSLSMDGKAIDLLPFTNDNVVQMSLPQQQQADNSSSVRD